MPTAQIVLEFNSKGEVASVRAAKSVGDAIDGVTKSAKQLEKDSPNAMAAVGKGADSASTGIKKMRTEGESASSGLAKMGKESDAAATSLGGLAQKIAGLGLGKLGAGVAGLYSLAKVKDFTTESFSLASTYETLGVVVQQVGKVNGYSAVEIDKNVSALRRMGIAGVEARKTMTQLLQAQVDIQQTPALARIAQDAAVIGGTNSSEAFERLVYGIQSAQTDVLRTIGISVNFEQAYTKMAAAVGKTSSELTEQEKVQARTNAVMEAGARISGTYEAALSTVGKQISSLTRLQNDFMTDFGKLPLEIAKATGIIDKYSSALDQMSRITLSSRANMAGISQTSLDEAFATGGTQGGRDLVESVEAAKDEINSLGNTLDALAARGIDVSGISEPFQRTREEFFKNQEEIKRLEAVLNALSDQPVDTTKIEERLNALRDKASGASTAVSGLRESVAVLFSLARAAANGGSLDAQIDTYRKYLSDKTATVDAAYLNTAAGSKERKIKDINEQKKALKDLGDAGVKSADEVAKINKALDADLASMNKGAEGAATKAANAAEKWKQFGLEIDALNGKGTKTAVTLEKQNKEIEDAGKAAGKSASEIQQMKDSYAAAFQTNSLKEFNQHIVELEGNSRAIRDLKIEEEVKKWTAELSNAGMQGAELAGNIDRLKAALERQAEVKDAQTSLSFIKEYSQLSGDYSQNQKILLEMLEEEAKIYRDKLPESLQQYIGKWAELQKLKNARDPFSGMVRGLRTYANDASDFAKSFESLTTTAFSNVETSFTTMLTTGQISFTNFANSIINDLARIAVRAAITGPIANGLSSLFSGWGSSVQTTNPSSSWANFGVTPGASMPLANAHGNVFSGYGSIHGLSNSIVSSPTMFSYDRLMPFANGGVVGETGRPEVIAPLARMSNGDLGIKGTGFGGGSNVSVNIINASGEEVTQRTKTDNYGNKSIDVMIGDAAAKQAMTQGTGMNRAIRAATGARTQVTRR